MVLIKWKDTESIEFRVIIVRIGIDNIDVDGEVFIIINAWSVFLHV